MIKKIGVLGAGQMGASIAKVAAMNGFSVILNDVSKAYLKGGIERIEKSLLITFRIAEKERKP